MYGTVCLLANFVFFLLHHAGTMNGLKDFISMHWDELEPSILCKDLYIIAILILMKDNCDKHFDLLCNPKHLILTELYPNFKSTSYHNCLCHSSVTYWHIVHTINGSHLNSEWTEERKSFLWHFVGQVNLACALVNGFLHVIHRNCCTEVKVLFLLSQCKLIWLCFQIMLLLYSTKTQKKYSILY